MATAKKTAKKSAKKPAAKKSSAKKSGAKKSGAKKTTAKNDPCWDGYTQVGMKDKNGKEVPNCVPEQKGK